MRLIWKGNWKKGEITIEAETVADMRKVLQELSKDEEIGELPQDKKTSSILDIDIPQISGSLGPADALREVLRSPWGKKEPRTMAEILKVLEANALYFSKGSISGLLSIMTKRSGLRRLKKGNMWAYVISEK